MKTNFPIHHNRVRFARIGWLLSMLALVGMACSALNQVSNTKSTAEAVASQVQGMATEGVQLAGTAQAFATQNPGALETLQAGGEALATNLPGLDATSEALMTETANGTGFGEAPADIPLLPKDQMSNFVAVAGQVSYSTAMTLKDVEDFYKKEMPNNGWTAQKDSTVEIAGMAVLSFTKENRTATLTFTADTAKNQTLVVILSQ